MQGLIFTAEQAKSVVAGELHDVRYPITQNVLGDGDFLARTVRFASVGRGSKYWGAFDDANMLCGTVSAPVVERERVYLAEPWTLRGGAPGGVLYEADALDSDGLPPGVSSVFWAEPYLMPWNASRRRLLVLEVQPRQHRYWLRLQEQRDPGIRHHLECLAHARRTAPSSAPAHDAWYWHIRFSIYQPHEEKKHHG